MQRLLILTILICISSAATVAQTLFDAAEQDETALADKLLRHGASVQQRNEFGHTPLFTAAENNALAVAELLLDSGADVNARASGSSTAVFNDDRTPLHEAAIFGHEEFATLLIEHGADVNAATIEGKTPLFYAVGNELPGMARLLLEAKADVNVRDSLGNTPLHELAITFPDTYENHELRSLLMEYGADETLTNKAGLTPKQAAAKALEEMKRDEESYF